MKNLDIGKRLAIGFGIIVTITGTVGAVALLALRDVRRDARDMQRDYLVRFDLSTGIETKSAEQALHSLRHVIAPTGELKAKIDKDMLDVRKDLNALFEGYEKHALSDEERGYLDTVKKLRPQRIAVRDRMLAFSKELKLVEATQVFEAEYEPLDAQYKVAIAALAELNRKHAHHAAEQIVVVSERAIERASLSVLVAFLASVVIALLITRSITRPLAKAVEVVQRVARGDLAARAEASGRDELARMLADMNTMVSNLEATAQIARRIAEGELSVQVPILSGDDVLGQSLDRMVGALRMVVSDVSNAADNVASGLGAAQQLGAVDVHRRQRPERGRPADGSGDGGDERQHPPEPRLGPADRAYRHASGARRRRQRGGHEPHAGGDPSDRRPHRDHRRDLAQDRPAGPQRRGGGSARRRARARLRGGGLRGT
jgi:methyl-accepting chemotaxis protein